MSISNHEARALIRKARKRVPEGEEIRHLNIMPMMDIMTILLVVFIMSETAVLSLGDVQLPSSVSNDALPEQAVALTIAREAVLVEGRPIVTVKNGAIDPSEKRNGALGTVVPRLASFLGRVRQGNEADLAARGQAPVGPPEVLIIADRTTPYRLLMEVLTSSRSPEAGFRRFRLIVLEDDR